MGIPPGGALKFRSARFVLLNAAVLPALFCQVPNFVISTVAGLGPALGDGGFGLNARFGAISAVAMGPDGSLYVADSFYHQVRRITPDGKIALFAGSVRGFAGDGGPATSAQLNTPSALTVDTGGDVFIGDSGNHRVRMVSIWGDIQTVAGNGQIAPSPAASPVLPGEGGPATSAPLNQIAGLALASNGDLVIADAGNNRVFRISNGLLNTIAGNATVPASLTAQPAKPATLQGPTGVTADEIGDIFFCELGTSSLRMIDAHGNLTQIAGPGSPLGYTLLQPTGLAIDSLFNIYIIEAGRISIYSPASPLSGNPASIQAIAGDITQKVTSGTGDNGPPLSAGMNPRGVAVDDNGNIYLADSLLTLNFNNRLRLISNNIITTFAGGTLPAGAGDAGPATSAQLYFPQSVAISPLGTLYIADTGDNRIRAVAPNGNISTVAGTGIAGTSGNQGLATAAQINQPDGLALDSTGNLYFTDSLLIRQVNTAGMISAFAGGSSSPLAQTGSLAIDSQNDVFVDQLGAVSEINPTKQLMATVAGNGVAGYSGDNGPAAAAQIAGSAGIALDSAGNLYIADQANGRVRKVDSTGNITTIAGGGTSTADGVLATAELLNAPSAVMVDSVGNLYIAEFGGDRIRMVTLDGNIHTIAGNGLQGFAGDGAVATSASLNGPSSIQLDAQGNIYIADSLNSAIRKLTPLATLPTPAINSISNAGSLLGGPVAPGERVVIAGTALGPNSTVMFDAHPAPVLTSSLNSITVQVPYEIAAQSSSQVTVTVNGITSAPFAAQVGTSAPGIYTLTNDGQGQVVALGSNGLVLQQGSAVAAGSPLAILCTGEGLVNPSAATGVPIGANGASPVLQVTATVNGEPTTVDGAYSLPGAIGQFIVTVEVPEDVPSDNSVTLMIMVGNVASQSTASISVTGAPDDSGDGGDLRTRKSGAKRTSSRR
jgi:uncharacterized protein (TIGR03437 family)